MRLLHNRRAKSLLCALYIFWVAIHELRLPKNTRQDTLGKPIQVLALVLVMAWKKTRIGRVA